MLGQSKSFRNVLNHINSYVFGGEGLAAIHQPTRGTTRPTHSVCPKSSREHRGGYGCTLRRTIRLAIIDKTLTPMQEVFRTKTSGLPDAADLERELGLRRAGIGSTWEHSRLVDALTGAQSQVHNTDDGDMSRWSFMRPDGSLGNARLPETTQEKELAEVVRRHDEQVAIDAATAQTEAQRQAQSESDLQSLMAATAAPSAKPVFDGLFQAQQSASRRPVAAPGQAFGVPKQGRPPGIAVRAPRPSPAFLPRRQI